MAREQNMGSSHHEHAMRYGRGVSDPLIPRKVATQVTAALADTRVVLISGARQAGKSTLVRVVAGDGDGEKRDLDKPQDHAAALADPVGFVDTESLLVIDEIQRAPDLLLAIKAAVDEDPRPGRFLLTGSSQLFGMAAAPDALPGRMETIELWPFSQGEIDGTPDRFIDAAFDLGADTGRHPPRSLVLPAPENRRPQRTSTPLRLTRPTGLA